MREKPYAGMVLEERKKHIRRLKDSMKSPGRNARQPRCCRCEYFQPRFRFRRCLFALCPYGKQEGIFREKPLKKEFWHRDKVVRVRA